MAKKKTAISKVQEIINDTIKKEKEKDIKIDKELKEVKKRLPLASLTIVSRSFTKNLGFNSNLRE